MSPTGKEWSQEFVYLYNQDKLNTLKEVLTSKNESNIERYCSEKNLDIPTHKYEVILQEMEAIENRGYAIPDGWIMLYADGMPYLCIAIENKLWDLDPFQLRNHMEKVLGIDIENFEKHKILKSYEDLYVKIESSMVTPIQQNLLEYFYLLGYRPFRPFTFNWGLFFDKLAKSSSYSSDNRKGQIWFNDIDVGNIYFDVCHPKSMDDPAVFIGSEIGVHSKDINIVLKEKMTVSDIENLSSHYDGFANEFVIYARFNAISKSDYVDLEYFDNLGDALKSFLQKPFIYKSGISKTNCLEFLRQNNYDPTVTKIYKYNHESWNILLYMRCITNMRIYEVCCSYDELKSFFMKLFEEHKKGLEILNSVYTR
jgi:hypothetical protein